MPQIPPPRQSRQSQLAQGPRRLLRLPARRLVQRKRLNRLLRQLLELQMERRIRMRQLQSLASMAAILRARRLALLVQSSAILLVELAASARTRPESWAAPLAGSLSARQASEAESRRVPLASVAVSSLAAVAG